MMEPTYTVTEQPAQSQSSLEIQRYKDGSYGFTYKKYTGSPLPDLEELYDYDAALKAHFTAPPDDLAEKLEASLAARQQDGA